MQPRTTEAQWSLWGAPAPPLLTCPTAPALARTSVVCHMAFRGRKARAYISTFCTLDAPTTAAGSVCHLPQQECLRLSGKQEGREEIMDGKRGGGVSLPGRPLASAALNPGWGGGVGRRYPGQHPSRCKRCWDAPAPSAAWPHNNNTSCQHQPCHACTRRPGAHTLLASARRRGGDRNAASGSSCKGRLLLCSQRAGGAAPKQMLNLIHDSDHVGRPGGCVRVLLGQLLHGSVRP